MPQPTLILPTHVQKTANVVLFRSKLAGLHSWFGLKPPNIRKVPSEFIPDETKLPKNRTHILNNIKEKLLNLHTIWKLLV
jgi:hypothetical protein